MTNDDIYEGEGCIEDLESGFDAVGILKLPRPVVTASLNPTPDSSSIPFAKPSPPEWCNVPNMCAICLDSYVPGQCVSWSSGCRHAFHQKCISHYLAKKIIGGETPCPSCRQKFCDMPEEEEPLTSSSTGDNIATSTARIDRISLSQAPRQAPSQALSAGLIAGLSPALSSALSPP